MDLKKWFDNDDLELDAVSEFIGTYKNIDLHKERASGSAIYKAIFNLFIINEARDWETFELPEYDNLDDHHIVPKSWGKEMGLDKDINTILNRAPLSGDTNRKIIRDSLPNVYIKNMFDNNDKEKVFKVLKSHLISEKAVNILLRENFSIDDYKEFISERKNTIINAIYNMVINESIELPEDLQKLNSDIENLELKFREIIIDNYELTNRSALKQNLPGDIYEKLNQKINRERKRNPNLVETNIEDAGYWMQFSDLQELQRLSTLKEHWPKFENIFKVNTVKLTSEFNDMANLRNALRHSREVDTITRMKGEASLLWFNQQLSI